MQPLALSQVRPLATALAYRIARCSDDVDDLIQVGLFAFYKQTRRRVSARQPWALAKTTLQRAMSGYYDRPQRQTVPLSPAFPAPDRQLEVLDLDEYLTALERRLGRTARRVAENLISPVDPACCASIMAEVRRKQRRRRAGDLRPRGCARTVRVSNRMVRIGLGLSPREWREQLARVRAFTREWLASC